MLPERQPTPYHKGTLGVQLGVPHKARQLARVLARLAGADKAHTRVVEVVVVLRRAMPLGKGTRKDSKTCCNDN